MGLVDLLLSTGGEESLNSKLGQWRMGVSTVVDSYPLYLTQTDWNVDSVNGNDANSGITGSPLRTLGELSRRWFGRTFAPTVISVSINLLNTTFTDVLNLKTLFTSISPTIVTIKGTMTQVASGSITAYAAWNSAGNIRAALTDGSQDFTAHVRRRIRITSGTAAGAVAGIGSLGGGPTIANVGQFRLPSSPISVNGANADPSVGDSYVVETFKTQLMGYVIDCPGAWVIIRDLEIITPASGIIPVPDAICISRQGPQYLLQLFGCRFNCSGIIMDYIGNQTFFACMHEGGTHQFYQGFFNIKGQCMFGIMSANLGCDMQRDRSMHDGNGTDPAHLFMGQSSSILDQTFAAFFGCTNAGGQTALVRLSGGSSNWILSSCFFWGAAGNLKTNALQVLNGSGTSYSAATVPKATGATPGVNDVVVSAVGAAWAALPILAAAPDNGFVNVYH